MGLHCYTSHGRYQLGAERTSFPTAPECYTVGGTTGQAETIRDGPGPGRCRGYLIT